MPLQLEMVIYIQKDTHISNLGVEAVAGSGLPSTWQSVTRGN